MSKILFHKQTEEVLEGAGVRLNRVFSHDETKYTDPFLLLDHFESKNEKDYIAGFPWHPHRGIETVTYLKKGEVDHKDSIGNSGKIFGGDIQWMTAGSGIIHEEMPQKTKDGVKGFQLWINLPKKDKMINPKYRGLTKNDIPIINTKEHTSIIIAGKIDSKHVGINDLSIPIKYFDINLAKDKTYSFSTKKDHTTLIYLYEGKLFIEGKKFDEKTLIVFKENENIELKSDLNSHFLFLNGKKINEPIAWAGPIVMNTNEELEIAFNEYQNGTFIKSK